MSNRPYMSGWLSAPTGTRMSSLSIAWLLLLLATFSHGDSSDATASQSQLSAANFVRFSFIITALALLATELRNPIRLAINPLLLFAVYATVCVLSTLWSVSPLITLGKAVELSAATATLLFAASRDPSGRQISALLDLTFWVGVGVLAIAATGYFMGFPGFWVHSKGLISKQIATWFVSANGIGYLAAFTTTIALNRMLTQSSQRLVMSSLYAFALVIAIIAQGRTGLFALVLGSLVVLAIQRQFIALLVAVTGMIALSLAFFETIQTYLVRGNYVENLQTLSGRTVMWKAAWESFISHPFAGVGFGVGGRSLFLTKLSQFGMTSLHNGFMELLTGVGLFGFVPWISSIGWTLANAVRSGLARKNVEAAAILVPVIATTVMSIGAGGWFGVPLAYFLCSTAFLGHAAGLRYTQRTAVQPSASQRR